MPEAPKGTLAERALAWDRLRDLPLETWARQAPAEYVRSGLAVDPDAALAAVRELVDSDPPSVRARRWWEVLTAVFGYGAHDLAREVFAIFDRHVRTDDPPWPDGAMHRDWLRPWIDAEPTERTAPSPGRPVVAIVDYHHPGARRASVNIGDHVQSLAMLGHLVRHRGLRFHGPPALTDLLATLGERVRPELRTDDVAADVEVLQLHRDGSPYQELPEGTWALCFGWYMHAIYDLRHAFPLHRNVRPLFISFHCNKRELLTDDARAYLRRNGPVGCRDWTTVHLLRAAGVPAFFSGCVTTTIGHLFPDAPPAPADAPVAYVDVPGAEGGVAYRHADPEVRDRPFADNARLALERLDTYRRAHPLVVTSRLHCHLPLRSIGVPTEFRAPNAADPRFDGLIGITDDAFDAMRDAMTEGLDRVLRRIVAGAGEDEVRALWRELTAADVAAAEAEHGRPVELADVPPAWQRRAADAAAATETRKRRRRGSPAGDAVHCAVLLEAGDAEQVPVVLQSLLEHASRPLHVWLVGTDLPRWASRFGDLTLSAVPAEPLGRRPGQLRRLLLPELVGATGRLVVLPVPATATGDVAELAGLDLGPHALAAARRPGVSGYGVLNQAANRLAEEPRLAAELRRAALTRHAFDFDAFSGDVLVYDLERLARDGALRTALAFAKTFRLGDVEALHLLLGPHRATVPERRAGGIPPTGFEPVLRA